MNTSTRVLSRYGCTPVTSGRKGASPLPTQFRCCPPVRRAKRQEESSFSASCPSCVFSAAAAAAAAARGCSAAPHFSGEHVTAKLASATNEYGMSFHMYVLDLRCREVGWAGEHRLASHANKLGRGGLSPPRRLLSDAQKAARASGPSPPPRLLAPPPPQPPAARHDSARE